MIAVTYSSLSNVEWSECKLMWSYLILFRKFTNCVRKMVIRKMINTLSCIEHDRLRFPSFFGPLESSQYPSSCSIFFPWLSGFYRVVNHICRWSQTQLVAVFIGSSKILKSRNTQLKLKFQRSQKISLAINSWIGLNILVFSKSLFPEKLKNNGYSNKNSSLVQKTRINENS